MKLNHIIAGAIFVILAFVTLRSFIFGESLFIYRDLLWPTDVATFFSSMWNTFDLESNRRIIYLGPSIIFAKAFGLSALDLEKSLFFLIRILTGLLAYFSVYKLISSKFNLDKKHAFIVSVLAGFFYAYNPFATTAISTTMAFALSYSLIPPVFYYFDKTINSGNLRNMLTTSILITLTLSGTTQFLVLLPLFVLAPWFIIICLDKGKAKIPYLIKNAIVLTLFCTLLSFYWIFVSIMIISEGVTLKPSYILTLDSLNTFSAGTSLVDVIRLMGDWWPRVSLSPIIDTTVWNALTFAIPIAMISFVLFLKKSTLKFYVISMFLISLFIIFFHKGTQPPIPDFYPVLYDIPIVGWMFRVPSKIGMVLSFFVTMIISLGFYGFLSSKSGRSRPLRYVALLCFVLVISLISWPMFTGDFGGVYKDNNKFVRSETIPTNADTNKIRVSSENIVVGAYGKYDSLTSLGLPQLKNSSFVFADEGIHTFTSHDLSGADNIILEDKDSLTMHFLPKDAITVYPFASTNRHDPGNVWSRAGTNDPLNGPFHNYFVKQFPMTNSDIDYGKGMVITWSKDKLDVPLGVKTEGLYDVYVRYLASVYGGTIRLYFDDTAMKNLQTKSQVNKFMWAKVGTVSANQGQHLFRLENNNGFNAVNLFALIPSTAYTSMEEQAKSIAEKPRNLFLFEAESDLYTQGKVVRNNTTLTLNAKSSAYVSLDIIKASDYTLAVRTKTCEECTTATVSFDGTSEKLSLKNDKTEFKWFYLTTHINPGARQISLSTGDQVEIDKIIVYSDSHIGETLEDLFSTKQFPTVSYQQLDPTQYEIKIRDMNNPMLLVFDQSYDPLWKLRDSTGREYTPLEVYPNQIGFIVNGAENLEMKLEYSPQIWFYIGFTVSMTTLLGSLAYLMLTNRSRILHLIMKMTQFPTLIKAKNISKAGHHEQR